MFAKRRCSSLICALSLVLLMSGCQSAIYGQAPKPGSELRKLDVFVGSWTFEWDRKTGAAGSSGKMTGIESYSWMPGGFLLRMDREGKGPEGDFKHLVLFGYNPAAGNYGMTIFSLTDGSSASFTGTVEGTTWKWSGAGTLDGKPFYDRCTWTVPAEKPSRAAKCEASSDGSTWAPGIEARYSKMK